MEKIFAYADDLKAYLKADNVIDYNNEPVCKLADRLFDSSSDEVDFIRKAYEYVRDNIAHSADAGEELVTCSASEVLQTRHGICFAKSHLLAAILRSKGVPTGFCYQKLILDDETAPVIAYRAMMGEYIIYYRNKVIGGIYDDRFLVKNIKAAADLMPEAALELPYDGAKEMLLVDDVENKGFLKELLEAMFDELPAPKKRK